MTAAQAIQLCDQAGAPRPPGLKDPTKEKVCGTRRKVIDGISFRSTLEARCYVLFRAWQMVGAITGLRCQPRYLLQPKMRVNGKTLRQAQYVADFEFQRGGRTVVIDAKGYRMEVYRLKAKLFQARYPDLVFEEWDARKLRENGG